MATYRLGMRWIEREGNCGKVVYLDVGRCAVLLSGESVMYWFPIVALFSDKVEW